VRKEPRWISKRAVLALHERLLAEHGGAAGLRDEGLLDAALSSPQNHFAYERVDLFDIAATYAVSITRNHPFSDGNKRVALTVAGVFLELNGYRLEASEQEAVAATVAISSRKLDRDGFASWLRGNSSRRSKEDPSRPRRSRKRK
jgi:death-on-curing protein